MSFMENVEKLNIGLIGSILAELWGADIGIVDARDDTHRIKNGINSTNFFMRFALTQYIGAKMVLSYQETYFCFPAACR